MNKSLMIATGLALMLPLTALGGDRHHHDCDHHHHKRKAQYHERKAVQHWRRAHSHAYRQQRDRRAYGRVVDVEPVYPVAHYRAVGNSCIDRGQSLQQGQSWTPSLLGGVIGAAVGYGLGEDHGDPEVATIAGSLLGASLGRDLGRHLQRGRELHVRGPCVSRSHQPARSEPLEYVVTYRYNGQTYRKRMDYDPGEWVVLNVEASPA